MSEPTVTPTPEPTPPRRRRKWPWVVLGLLVALAAGVALLPTLCSIGPMRQYLVGRINRNLSGHLEVADWSVGWHGSELRNVKLFDPSQAEVLSVARLQTSLSFFDLLRGQYDCGTTLIEEPNFTQLVVGTDRTLNLQNVFPAPPARKRGKGAGVQFTGDFTITRLRATVVDRRDGSTLFIEPSTASVKITGLQDPVTYEATITVRGAATQPSTLRGTVKLPNDLANALNGGGDKIPVAGASLAGAKTLLRALGRTLNPPTTRPASTAASTEPAAHRRRRPAQ